MFELGANCKFLLDVGCNVAQSSLLVAHRGKLENCVLIDPNPEALAQATFNIIRNFPKLSVKPVCAFASDRSKQQVDFFTIGTGAAGSVYREHAKSASLAQQHFYIQTICLDDLVFEEDKSPDLIKIDVEGAEKEVLMGTKVLVGRYSPLIHVEMHSNPDLSMSQNAQSILDWCDDVGYTAWYLKEKNRLISASQIAHRGRCHLLLQRNDLSFPEELKEIKQGDPLPI